MEIAVPNQMSLPTLSSLNGGDVFQLSGHYWIRTIQVTAPDGYLCVNLAHGGVRCVPGDTRVDFCPSARVVF